ncbi:MULTISPECIES: DUF2577 domain-containing protein [Paenibacillus]|jgi:hypothetical protein|uniref:DUF2577 domain-containing protein n=1 Tax=Paenibacillus agaridevorans TaxID=171404 RepID=A0A2R5EYY8_9BACL|nr:MULTISPECIES: DUF2577 domain-containing protein [Paenibacillus]QNK57546.1 DUF2577 domain-containing protein [Paenibacillus sp. PAMC21692]GBG11335.1 hypothetical protein PAT3040_06136 [Paenibacillus agaridevorans]
MSMLDVIKKAGIGAVEAGQPVQVQFGQVVSLQPLAVRLDQRLTLPSGALVVPESLAARALAVGDSLILLRMQGGQSYVVLDRMVTP